MFRGKAIDLKVLNVGVLNGGHHGKNSEGGWRSSLRGRGFIQLGPDLRLDRGLRLLMCGGFVQRFCMRVVTSGYREPVILVHMEP